jgi:hypothetical protein
MEAAKAVRILRMDRKQGAAVLTHNTIGSRIGTRCSFCHSLVLNNAVTVHIMRHHELHFVMPASALGDEGIETGSCVKFKCKRSLLVRGNSFNGSHCYSQIAEVLR